MLLLFVLHFHNEFLAIVCCAENIVDNTTLPLTFTQLLLVAIDQIGHHELSLEQRIQKADQDDLAVFLTKQPLKSKISERIDKS